jgi:hypothetical protein
MLKTVRTIASLAGAWLVATVTAGTVVSTVGTDVVTYHNDVGRTGQNLTETALTLQTVNTTMFGKLGLWATDGKVDAQPLYLSAVSIPGQGAKNMLYIATEHDSVYGFNADNGTVVWHVSLLGAGEVPSDAHGCDQVVPEIGVTSTPVIDRSRAPNGVIYVVAMSKIGGTYYQRLHALDVTSGAELFGGPRVIQATFPSNSGGVTFDPGQYEERSALLLANGRLVLSFTSHCDGGTYYGWMMAYDPATLNQTAVLNVTPNGGGGAFWGAGNGPAADAAGNFYILSGNGTFDTTLNGSGFPVDGDFGNGFLKISMAGGLSVADYFQTWDTVDKSNADTDLGSGGAMVLPDVVDGGGQVRHLAVGAGKDSHIYVVDRDSMSKWHSSTNQNYQDISNGISGGVWSSPAYFNGTVYYGSVGDAIKAFPITAGRLATTAATRSAHSFGYPGATPGISASGTTNGIVWAVENSSPAVLHAFDAQNLAHELYNSTQAAGSRDNFGGGNKFITPTIVNGHVYVGTSSGVAVFGNITTIPATPTNMRIIRGDGLQ